MSLWSYLRASWPRAISTLLFFVVVVSQPGVVDGEERGWVFADVVGEVRLTTGATGQVAARPMRQGDVIEPGQAFATGPNASAKLVNGRDLMIVRPNSVVRLPVAESPTLGTRIQQRLGRVLFHVEPGASPRFAVETPLLVAVVKGTSFEVDIGNTGTSVTVFEGIVETVANGSGTTATLVAGQTVNVSSGFERELTIDQVDQSSGHRGRPGPLGRLVPDALGTTPAGAERAESSVTSSASGHVSDVSQTVGNAVNDVSGSVNDGLDTLGGGL